MEISHRADGGLAPTEGNDDGIVGGPRTPQQIAAQKRLQQTQAQVDEVSETTTQFISFLSARVPPLRFSFRVNTKYACFQMTR